MSFYSLSVIKSALIEGKLCILSVCMCKLLQMLRAVQSTQRRPQQTTKMPDLKECLRCKSQTFQPSVLELQKRS